MSGKKHGAPEHCTAKHYFMMLLLSVENWNFDGMTHSTSRHKLENEGPWHSSC